MTRLKMAKKVLLRTKILVAISILLIGCLQFYIYEQHKMAVLRGKDLVSVKGKMIHHEPFKVITVEYKIKNTKTNIQVERTLDNTYDPFVNIDLSQLITITYDRQNPTTFYIDGYENKPSCLFFYFVAGSGFLAQLVFIGILLGYIDDNFDVIKKR